VDDRNGPGYTAIAVLQDGMDCKPDDQSADYSEIQVYDRARRRIPLERINKDLLLSALRFVVFVVQYILMLQLFHVELNLADAICTTCVLFLVLAVIPTVPLADIGVRGEAGLQLFGLLTANTVGIIATTFGIWFLNLILPSMAGSLFILGIKIFKKQQSK